MSAPIDTPCPLGSLANNAFCGIDWRGNGTYTAEGITKLCEGLKGSAVISLRCAATPKCLLLCQRPLTQMRTVSLVPSLASPPPTRRVRRRTRSLSGTHFLLWPALLSHTRKRTRTLPSPFPHPRDAALHCAPHGPRPRPPVGRLGRACSRAHLSPPATLPVTACGTTASPSETPRACSCASRRHKLRCACRVGRRRAASALPSIKRPRCATPPPGVPTPDSPATPDFIAHDDYALSHRLACVRD